MAHSEVLPRRVEISEKELQVLVEKDMNRLEQGLVFIDHFVPVGSGIIDTLALDNEKSPVIIEYKAVPEADEEGLIQILAYADWIDKNPDALLRFVSEKKSEALGGASLGDVRTVLVAPDFTERTRHAADMIEHDIALVKYMAFEHPAIGRWLHFDTIFDSRTARPGAARIEVYKIDDHFQGAYARMKPLFDRLASEVNKFGPDVRIYAKKHYIAFQRNYIFAVIHIYTNKVEAGMVLESSEPDPRLLDASDWGWSRVTHCVVLTQDKDIDEKVLEWLRASYSNS